MKRASSPSLVEAFASGQTARYDVNYQHEGLDSYSHLVARRSGERLVVSFTDTTDQPRSAVEKALRESQAREQAARAETERHQAELQRVFQEAPVAMGLMRGLSFVLEWTKARMGKFGDGPWSR
jgi:hypothetical protein